MKSKLIAIFLVCSALCSLRAEEIQVRDIGSKVIIIGTLGKPIGTIATVYGQLVSEPKQGKSGQITAAIRINKVDGKPLEKGQVVGIIFRISAGVPLVHAHDFVQFSRYEAGAFVGTPDKPRELLGKDVSPLDFQFEPELYVIQLQPVDSTKP